MNKKKGLKPLHGRIIYTVLAAILLCIVLLSVVLYVYQDAEDDSFENLHIQTRQIKENINLQMNGDRENLQTMASLGARLYSDGDNLALLVDSFEPVGLLESVEILLPDDTLLTKKGRFSNLPVTFQDVVQQGEFITRRTEDFTTPGKYVIHSAVPIKYEGTTVAILYGVINLETFTAKYEAFAAAQDARLFIIERSTGDFIADTWNDMDNIFALGTRVSKKGYSYQKMCDDIVNGISGYSAFLSTKIGEYLYVHYAPMEVQNWQIMLAQPENIVLAEARATNRLLLLTFLAAAAILGAYLLLIFYSERRQAKLNLAASDIRRLLLEVSRSMDKIWNALELITGATGGRSSFYVDTDGEDFCYILPAYQRELLTGEAQKYFVRQLFNYAEQRRSGNEAIAVVIDIPANRRLKQENPGFYQFLTTHQIEDVCYVTVADEQNNMSILGVMNPHSRDLTRRLLRNIGVCFSMAVHNKKYLTATEAMAVTDSLTGLSNHTAYMQALTRLNRRETALNCIYIDVNELHYINNSFGHAAGDEMLVYIANILRREFADSYVYRTGGDEYLIFTEGLSQKAVEERMQTVTELIAERNYHISVGITRGGKEAPAEELVKIAEKLMYENKAKYYQEREYHKVTAMNSGAAQTLQTGVKEVDACLAVMSTRYLGVYCVSLKSDDCLVLLAPSYFELIRAEDKRFSAFIKRYIHDLVMPEYQRILLKFLEYDVVARQLQTGHTPRVSYTKIDGDRVRLSIYAMPEQGETVTDTIWIFEKEEL